MQPADIVKRDRLADAVCHPEQMTVWVGEVKGELLEHLKDPEDYEDLLALDRAVEAAIRHVVEAAFSHPEILGIEDGRCD